MLQQLLLLFFTGLALCLVAYFLKELKVLRRILFAVGGLLIALPFLLLIYFIVIILTA
ncbi:TPA: hypothetical protein U0K67_001316 [Streptococcus suis]|nr:hypothetical protein [Streptococcus suis]